MLEQLELAKTSELCAMGKHGSPGVKGGVVTMSSRNQSWPLAFTNERNPRPSGSAWKVKLSPTDVESPVAPRMMMDGSGGRIVSARAKWVKRTRKPAKRAARKLLMDAPPAWK